MSKLEHPLSEEELMAYADGELSGPEVSKAEKHIQECSHCAQAVADAKELSRQVTSWTIEEAPRRIAENVLAAMPKRTRWWANSRVWVYGFGGAFVIPLLLYVFVAPSLLRSRQAALEPPPPADTRLALQALSAITPSGPMVIRTITLALITKEFDSARPRIDAVIQQFQGYVDNLTLRADTGSARGLSAKLRIPSNQADSAVNELKKLGRLVQEQQNSSDVTSQYVDLTARISNARNSEQRLLVVLRERTGNLKDVVEVERELASVRESIERMEAQQKDLNNKVQYVTIQLELSEEYRAELAPPAPSTSAQLRNASIDGIHSAADTILDLTVFALRYGPALLIWFAVISPIVILIWRHTHKVRNQAKLPS